MMDRNRTLRLLATAMLAGALISMAGPEARAQQPERDCTVRPEASGLIRGDRIPRGCVLQQEGASRYTKPEGHDWTTALGPCEQYSERIFHTPNPKRSVLTNAARICRPMLEASDPANWSSPDREAFRSFNRHFGSTQRQFGKSRRHFGSPQRHFDSPFDRNFGREPGGDR